MMVDIPMISVSGEETITDFHNRLFYFYICLKFEQNFDIRDCLEMPKDANVG